MYKTWAYMKSGANNASHIYSCSGQYIDCGLLYNLSVLCNFVGGNFYYLLCGV
jgi:hypothetical protein